MRAWILVAFLAGCTGLSRVDQCARCGSSFTAECTWCPDCMAIRPACQYDREPRERGRWITLAGGSAAID